MKPTLRVSGKRMITVRPRFDLDGETIVRLVARETWDEASDYGDREEPAELTRKQVEDALVRHLQGYGWMEVDDWASNLSLDEETQQRAWQWARAQVVRVWPELADEIKEEKP